MRLNRYFNTKKEFVQFKDKIKLVPCPHCHKFGFLILHGPLYGLCLDIKGRQLYRGHRYLCSNRKNRSGCGRTFSILMSYVLKYLQASAFCLWRFLSSLKQGKTKSDIFTNNSFPFTSRCVGRWLGQLKKYQYAIRTRLLKKSQPPHLNSSNPLVQLFYHIKKVFIGNNCPIVAYQNYFQVSFLKD